MKTYDAVMEARYQRQLEEDDAYMMWCEENDLDPSDDHTDAYREAQANAEEDAAVAAYEAAMEDRYFD